MAKKTLHTFFEHGYYEPLIADGKLRNEILKKIKPLFKLDDPIYVEVSGEKFYILKGESRIKWSKYTEDYLNGELVK